MENLKLVALSIILWGDIGAHGVAFSTEQQQQQKKNQVAAKDQILLPATQWLWFIGLEYIYLRRE